MALRRERLTAGQVLARLATRRDGRTWYRAPGSFLPLDAIDAGADRDALQQAADQPDTGSVLFAFDDGTAVLVVPSFPVSADAYADAVDPEPLIELLERPRAYAVFLLRLGGFSVGLFRGDALVDSKTDQRFVKNRNRKGGQSQRRFERIREKQIDELFDKACAAARERLSPYDREIEHVFLGGDRRTLLAFRKACGYFESFGGRLMRRVLHVPGDPREAVLRAMPREVGSSDVWTLEPGVAPERAT
jgi:hypothetical protein